MKLSIVIFLSAITLFQARDDWCHKRERKCVKINPCKKEKCKKERDCDWFIGADSSFIKCERRKCESTSKCIKDDFCHESRSSSRCRRRKYRKESSSYKKTNANETDLIAAIDDILSYMAVESSDLLARKNLDIQNAVSSSYEQCYSAIKFQIGTITSSLLQTLSLLMKNSCADEGKVKDIVFGANKGLSLAAETSIQLNQSRSNYQLKELAKLSNEAIVYEVKDQQDGLMRSIDNYFDDTNLTYQDELLKISQLEMTELAKAFNSTEELLKQQVLEAVYAANLQAMNAVRQTLSSSAEALKNVVSIEFRELNLSLELLYHNVKKNIFCVVKQADSGQKVTFTSHNPWRRPADLADNVRPWPSPDNVRPWPSPDNVRPWPSPRG